MSPQAGKQRPCKRPDACFTVERLAQIAAIVAAGLALLGSLTVRRVIIDCHRTYDLAWVACD
jgi:hypothetical protein